MAAGGDRAAGSMLVTDFAVLPAPGLMLRAAADALCTVVGCKWDELRRVVMPNTLHRFWGALMREKLWVTTDYQ